MPFSPSLQNAANLMLANALGGGATQLADLFYRQQPAPVTQRPDPPPAPAQASSPAPSSSQGQPPASGTAGGLQGLAAQQANLLQSALMGGGASFLPNLGNVFNTPVTNFGLFPTLGQLPNVLGPIQGSISPTLTANQAIAALFQPQSYTMGQMPSQQGNENQWGPVLSQSAIGPALQALALLLLGG
ncbi:MAG: hypothetical protein E6R03_04320 [Hyphomicrobiaceae bacterium]|nr:MAG: hypothetical protein E6R03_04320 [Hyphomicrobiaceae bacterium]